MKDSDCVAFLQWALPRVGHRWPGYRKVRRQVCRRLARRIADLGLHDTWEYRDYLDAHDGEWASLEQLLPITISRFFRDRDVFDHLCGTLLPELCSLAAPGPVRIWSAGCGGGEEPYTLTISARRQRIPIEVLGTDVDVQQLRRARKACYSYGSLKDLPSEWRSEAFQRQHGDFCLRPELRANVAFCRQDVRRQMPAGPFHLVLCRYLVFTYFDEEVQEAVAGELYDRLVPGGVLVLGKRETWPAGAPPLLEVRSGLRIYCASERLRG